MVLGLDGAVGLGLGAGLGLGGGDFTRGLGGGGCTTGLGRSGVGVGMVAGFSAGDVLASTKGAIGSG